MDNIRKRTAYDWGLELLSFIALLCALIPLFFYKKIDDSDLIPIHYNITGQADGWGDSSSLVWFSLLALALYVLFLVLDSNYKALNYPVKITRENANVIYRLGVRLIRHLKLLLTVILAYLNNATLAVALGKDTGVNVNILIPLTVALFLVVLYFAVRMIQNR